MMIRTLFLSATLLLAVSAHALTPEEVKGMALGDTMERVDALNKAAAGADEKTAAFIQALADDAVKTAAGKVFVIKDDKGYDPISGAELAVPPDAEDVINNNMMRGELDTALAALKLFSKDEKVRRDAIKTLSGGSEESRLPLIEKAYAAEKVADLKSDLALVRAAILLGSSDKAKRLDAAARLSGSDNRNSKTVLIERLRVETDPEVRTALQASLRKVEEALAWATSWARFSAGSAWAASCCWSPWAWRSPTG